MKHEDNFNFVFYVKYEGRTDSIIQTSYFYVETNKTNENVGATWYNASASE
jgi:hypothetical protein